MYGREQDEYVGPEIHEMNWRAQAKKLGIRMCRRTKVDVLADIEAAKTEGVSLTAIQMPEGVSVIEPIAERPPWEDDGKPTEVEELMRRIETLENRLNRVIEAISKSKKVKGL